MKMLMKDGTIVEGTPITDEDQEQMKLLAMVLSNKAGGWTYLYQRDCEKIASYLVLNYEIKLRENPIVTAIEVSVDEELPIAYPVPSPPSSI